MHWFRKYSSGLCFPLNVVYDIIRQQQTVAFNQNDVSFRAACLFLDFPMRAASESSLWGYCSLKTDDKMKQCFQGNIVLCFPLFTDLEQRTSAVMKCFESPFFNDRCVMLFGPSPACMQAGRSTEDAVISMTHLISKEPHMHVLFAELSSSCYSLQPHLLVLILLSCK